MCAMCVYSPHEAGAGVAHSRALPASRGMDYSPPRRLVLAARRASASSTSQLHPVLACRRLRRGCTTKISTKMPLLGTRSRSLLLRARTRGAVLARTTPQSSLLGRVCVAGHVLCGAYVYMYICFMWVNARGSGVPMQMYICMHMHARETVHTRLLYRFG